MPLGYRTAAVGLQNGPGAMQVAVTIPGPAQSTVPAARVDDTALAWVSTGQGQTADFVAPNGWQIVGVRVDSNGQSNAMYRKAIVAGDLDTAHQWTYVTGARATATVMVVSGALTSNPIASAQVNVFSSNGTVRTAPAVAAAGLLIEYAALRGQTGSWTIPAGFTAPSGAFGANNGSASITAQGAYSTTNLTGGDTWTQNAATNNAAIWSVALNAAPDTLKPGNFFAFI